MNNEFWVCLYCQNKFTNVSRTASTMFFPVTISLERLEADCPDCGRAMELYESAVTPITPDLPIILTGLKKKARNENNNYS